MHTVRCRFVRLALFSKIRCLNKETCVIISCHHCLLTLSLHLGLLQCFINDYSSAPLLLFIKCSLLIGFLFSLKSDGFVAIGLFSLIFMLQRILEL